MTGQPPSPDHLSAQQLAAYVSRSLSPEEREAAIEHLAGCAPCRDEALTGARGLRTERTRKAWRVAAPVVVVAALAVVGLVYGPGVPAGSGEPVVRDGATEGPAFAIGVHAPGSTAQAEGIEFTWQSMGPQVRYRFSLTRSDGSEIWSGGTTDTSLTIPPDVLLSEGQTYFWLVDALLLDGRSVTTDVQQLMIVR